MVWSDGWRAMMGSDDGWGAMMGSHGGWGGLAWLGMGLGSLVVVGLIVLLVVLVVGGLGHDRRRTVAGTPLPGTGSPTAQQILEERFARGDLTEEEYRRRREVLQGG